MYDSFHPGQIWLDQEGKRIQAHGGSVFYLDGVYYWYGENKEKTTGDNNIWHWGVRCYASTDLYNWEDKGIIIPPAPDDLRSSLHPSSQMDRPHIIYNKETQKFVCWLKIMHKDGSQTVTVLTAEHILGPYEKVRENLRPLNMNAGDFDLVVADDGKAYYYFERVHSETICADLTADYRVLQYTFSTPISTLCKGSNRSFLQKRKALSCNIRHYRISAEPFGNCSRRYLARSISGTWKSTSGGQQ